MTTCHAPSAEDALDAIRLMVKQHQAGRHYARAGATAPSAGSLPFILRWQGFNRGQLTPIGEFG
jgi:hypothetical protein